MAKWQGKATPFGNLEILAWAAKNAGVASQISSQQEEGGSSLHIEAKQLTSIYSLYYIYLQIITFLYQNLIPCLCLYSTFL